MVLDNLATYLSLDAIKDVLGAVEFVHGDVRCPEDLARLGRKSFERVYHLAGSFANQLSVEHPLVDVRSNLDGTRHVLDFAREVGCGLFVYGSTSSSYGDAPVPTDEDAPMRPQTPYARTKLEGELCTQASGLSSVVFRLFNVYGPGDPPGRYRNAIPNMMRELDRDGRLRIFGREATRDFTYVDDVVRVLVDADRAVGQSVNVGTGVETPLLELAHRVLHLFESTGGSHRAPAAAGVGPGDAPVRIDRSARAALRVSARHADRAWSPRDGEVAPRRGLRRARSIMKLPEAILFVGAHCDDIELFAGGLLARACFSGARVGTLVFSHHAGVVDDEGAARARAEMCENLAWLQAESGAPVTDHTSRLLPACRGRFEAERAANLLRHGGAPRRVQFRRDPQRARHEPRITSRWPRRRPASSRRTRRSGAASFPTTTSADSRRRYSSRSRSASSPPRSG